MKTVTTIVKILEVAKVEIKRVSDASKRGFQVNDDGAREQVGVEGRGLQAADRLLDLRGPQAGGFAKRRADQHVLPDKRNGEKERAHREQAEREQEQDPGEFAEEVFITPDGFGENGVDRAIFDIARQELRGGHDREERGKMLIAPN